MLIGELARQVGLAPSALRYYEALGLLRPAGRRGGRRIYGAEAVDLLAFIRFAQTCGFQLDEIKVLLGVEAGAGVLSKRLQKLALGKMKAVDELIAHAQGMKRFLEAALRCRCIS